VTRRRSDNPAQLALLLDAPAGQPAPVSEPPVADASERRSALDPARSFIVQAPAGSGKTGLLIQRCLALLARVRVPEEVVAITFTRKAAGEMRSRVLEALAGARSGRPAKSAHDALTLELARAVLVRDQAKGWGLELNPGRLQMHTIDALCAALSRRMPLLSQLGPAPGVQEDARELYREAARETLALLEDPGHGHGVAALLRHLDNDLTQAQRMLADMMAQRARWRRHMAHGRVDRAALEAALARVACQAMERARASVPEVFAAGILATVRYAAANAAQSDPDSPLAACADLAGLPGAALEDLPVWRSIVELFLTSAGALRKNANQVKGFPAITQARGDEQQRRRAAKEQAEELLAALVAHEPFVAALQDLRALPPVAYDQTQWAFIEALAALLPLALAQLELTFRRHGAADFTQLAQGAIQALGEPDAPTDLALALDYRIQHLLIDEFQDTSFTQFELLRRLIAGWQPGDGRTLFAVGDPMQSIYRFREAEVALFLRARHGGVAGLELVPLTLQVNFRSQGALVQWVNDVFAQVLPRREDEDERIGAVSFAPSVAQEAALPGEAASTHVVIGKDRAAEARVVAELVARAQAADAGDSIALLVRNRSHLAQIVPQLKRAGLRPRAIEIELLMHRPMVRDLYALTRALLHPADRTAWLSVLRAPWCGMRLSDLEALAGADHEGLLWVRMTDPDAPAALSADGAARLGRVVAALSPVVDNRARGRLRLRVEGAWTRLGGPACSEDATDIEDALVFLSLLDELEHAGELEDLGALDERLEQLYALPDEQAPQAFQVMTIHKAKGLEFDTVIVAGLGYGARRDDPRLLNWLELPSAGDEPELLLAALAERGRDTDPIDAYIRRLDQQRQVEEDKRLLYVALTRARARLHLVGHVEVDGEAGCAKPPGKGSLLARLWPALEAQLHDAVRRHLLAAPQADGAATEQAPAEPPQRIQRLPADWLAPAPPAAVQWRRAQPAAAMEEPAIEFDWVGETARHVGTVVHRLLQRIAEDGLARWDAARVQAVLPAARAALRAEGVPAAELQAALERVRRALEGVLADERGRWVLGAHAQAQSELRLGAQLDGETVHIALDRTFVDAQGTRWIVDYKTSTHEGAQRDTFLDREQARYQDQLERYARAMQGLDPRPVRVALYFPLLQAWREWAPAGQGGTGRGGPAARGGQAS
jgi:ATP-dependent exoDNAse (exonuclease V) beta subunit